MWLLRKRSPAVCIRRDSTFGLGSFLAPTLGAGGDCRRIDFARRPTEERIEQDARKFDRMVREHRREMVAKVFKELAAHAPPDTSINEADVEDVVQGALLKAWEGWVNRKRQRGRRTIRGLLGIGPSRKAIFPFDTGFELVERSQLG